MKIKTKTVHAVEAYDFEQFVKEQTGRNISFQAAMECGNDTDHELTPYTNPDKWDKDHLNDFLTGVAHEQYSTPELLLGKFVNEGLIPEGTYLISISY